MQQSTITPNRAADDIRRALKDGGSSEHAAGVQWFFKDEIKSHGWYTATLRKAAVQCRRSIARERGMDFVVRVADKLFVGRNLEEKAFAVFLLEKQTKNFSDSEFQLFASWLDRVSSWADHDALAHDVLAPMIAAKPTRSRDVLLWAKSPNRWRRRAACVALIRGAREHKFFTQIVRLSNLLLDDEDDMVQKGLGWLLRETAKADAARTVPYLMKIREKAPRLVLRTACETLPVATRKRVLFPR
ncbi:MAG TPA: DNA alkylation repair protein [Terriglobales bacterium]|nr:DNA alkylation repair protein [Terriglobales bacterium]